MSTGRGRAVLAIEAELTAADVPRLIAQLRRMLQEDAAATPLCDVGEVIAPDLGTIDALARLQLRARALGAPLELCNVSPRLCELLVLAGLTQALPIAKRRDG